MRKSKQLLAALLLTMLLICLVPLNEVDMAVQNSQIGEGQISYAAAMPEIRLKKPVYDDDGNLIGCYGKGNKCVIVVMSAGGIERELLITAREVVLR